MTQVGSYSPPPPPSHEPYTPPPPWDPTNEKSENSESTTEGASGAEFHYRSEIYTPEPKFTFVGSEPVGKIWKPPAVSSTQEPESPPRSRIRSFICNDQVIGVSFTIGSVITIAIDAAVIFRIEPFTTALPAGVVVAVAALAAFGIGLYFMTRTGD